MKKPTKQEVAAEIKWLIKNKKRIPERTFFGDSNHDDIEAQIRALEEEMTENDAEDAWPWDGNEENRLQTAALDAIHWRDGEEKESPSEGWKPLIKQ